MKHKRKHTDVFNPIGVSGLPNHLETRSIEVFVEPVDVPLAFLEDPTQPHAIRERSRAIDEDACRGRGLMGRIEEHNHLTGGLRVGNELGPMQENQQTPYLPHGRLGGESTAPQDRLDCGSIRP